jgi:CheY-like chemotaxis protein
MALVRQAARESVPKAAKSDASQEISEQPNESSCKILVVEDKEIAAMIQSAFTEPGEQAEKLAERYGFPRFSEERVRIAINYEQAIAQLEAACALPDKQLDLVVLDLDIPTEAGPHKKEDLLGFKVLEKIRNVYDPRLHYHLPVVVLSSNVSTTREDSFGFDYFKSLLKKRKSMALPDEILLKEKEQEHPGYLDPLELLKKTAKYLVDLNRDDLAALKSAGIFMIESGATKRVLRQLKRIARSVVPGQPLPDVLLLGENGVGKSTFARAYDALRRTPKEGRIRFISEDLGSLDMQGGSAPSLRLFGSTGWSQYKNDENAFTLGSFSRATAYIRQEKCIEFIGQEFSTSTGSSRSSEGRPKVGNYPKEGDKVDYDASATLFLDEVVNISPEMQAMLLQALGYDRKRRHVFTTGRISRSVPVGPAIVMATRKKIDEMAKEDGGTSLALRDYLFRIDQVRVNIPPLRERKEEIIPFLKRAVGSRRGTDGNEILIDPRVKHVLINDLRFDNNFADLERIADQVQEEEGTITFNHVRALYDREVLEELRKEINERMKTIEGCIEYLKKVELDGSPKTITELLRDPDLSPRSVYCVGCSLFIYKLRSETTKWPVVELTHQYFGDSFDSFKASMTRLGKSVWAAEPGFGAAVVEALSGLDGVKLQIERMVTEQAARTGTTAVAAASAAKAATAKRSKGKRANNESVEG